MAINTLSGTPQQLNSYDKDLPGSQKSSIGTQRKTRRAFLSLIPFAFLFLLQFTSPSSMFANAATAGWDQMSSECQERLFPISSGGSKDEMVSCTLFDKKNGLIIVAGNSSSEDYAPAANDHAFAYAVDLEGNWMWGKFFYNVSFAVSTISGCHLDANNRLVLLGQGDSKPVIMELDPRDGLIKKFMSLEKIGTTSDDQPWYKTFGAIYHDTSDYYEPRKSFYYVAFIMSDYTQILKIDSEPNPATANPQTHDIRWNYEYKDPSTDAWKNKKTPRFLHQDAREATRMYLMGRHYGKAAMFKFDKKTAQLEWRLEINQLGDNTTPNSQMTDVLAYVQPEGQRYIYACGYSFVDATTDSTNKKAVMFKVSDDGDVQYMYSWGQGLVDQPDNCRSIAYDYQQKHVVALLEATSPNLRPDYAKYSRYSDKNSDTVLVIMKDGGTIMYGYNINMHTASVSMKLAENSMFVLDNHYVFGGMSFGYKTKMQNVSYSPTAPTLDTFLFRYDPSDSSCMYQSDISGSDLRSALVQVDVRANTKLTRRETIFTHAKNFFAYSSRYSGAFDLGDTMKYPRMCASASINMTGGNGTGGVQYYRGQNEKSYWIGLQSNAHKALGKMDRGIAWMFQNGTDAQGLLGRFDRGDRGGTIWVKTDSEDAVGISRTILRGCSHFNKLYEIYLYIEVLSNTYPDFVNEIETSWTLSVNKTFKYQLPPLKDKEGNDEPVVYIRALDTQAYPPFLTYNNYTRELTFRPNSVWYSGLRYHFAIVVKEKHSDSVLYPYYCTVKVLGKEPDRLEEKEYTDVTFKLTPITRNSTGAVIFSSPVNLTFVKENWDAMFDVYIKNVTFRKHNTTWPLLDFEFTSLGGEYGNDSMTMNFTATFHQPYMLGLLVKKSDKLYVHLKYDLLDTYGFFKPDKQYFNGMILGDVSTTRFMREHCEKDQLADKDVKQNPLGSTQNRENMYDYKRIELQFDFRNDVMTYMREFAVKCYWYLLGVISFQFFMLFCRDIGFLPLWTLIEYMQLCAFIPLYNFRLIPYLYDTFKPFLVSHLVLSNKSYILTEMEDDYFNINYDYYWLNTAKLGQALALMFALFVITVVLNVVVLILWLIVPKKGKAGNWIAKQLSQFRFNAYIRLYMLMYFDLTFFSVMKLVENNDSTPNRRMATIASYVILTLSFVIPFFLMSIVCKRYEVMKIKQAKQSFNTVVLKIDKQSRWRLVVPGYFFFRRFLTAVLLSMPIDNTFIFLQYVFILMSSHAYVLYLVAIKPYQSPLLNNYVLSNETFYSALIIAIFIFSDATPELNIKFAAAIVLISSVFLLIFANLVMIIVLMCKGPDKLKEEIKQAKLKRAEKELMEEEEEEERRQRQQREEEEFTRLPEDTANIDQYDLNADADNTKDMLKGSKKRKGKKSKKKNKNDNDEVITSGVTQGNTSEMGNTTQGMLNDTAEPLKSKKKKDKKKKRRDKNKNKQDDVDEAAIGGPAQQNESPTASSENKKSRDSKKTSDGQPNSESDAKASDGGAGADAEDKPKKEKSDSGKDKDKEKKDENNDDLL